MRLILLISTLLLLCFYSSEASINKLNYQYSFRAINTNQGLSNSQVYSITEDEYGFIWAGTKFGLNKLTSTNVIKYYQDDNDINSIPSNVIYAVYSDCSGRLWIGTAKGLCYYNKGRDCFERIENDFINDDYSIFNISGDQNTIWFSTEIGLLKYSLETQEYFLFNTENSNLPNEGVLKAIQKSENELLLSLFPQGIAVFNTARSTTDLNQKFIADNGADLANFRIESLYKDKSGNFWIGTFNNGAFKYVNSSSEIISYNIDLTKSYSSRVRVFFEDLKGDFYTGTRAGLYKYSDEDNRFYVYATTDHLASRLSNNSVTCSYIDRANELWLGTYSGGLNYTNLKANKFISYLAETDDAYSLNNPKCMGIEEDNNGNIYVGTENGINILNTTTSRFEYITAHPHKPGALRYADVKDIAIKQNGDFWVGTNNGGLNYYSKSKDEFLLVSKVKPTNVEYDISKIYATYLDEDENLWFLAYSPIEHKPSILGFIAQNSKEIEIVGDGFSFGFQQLGDRILIGGLYGFWEVNQDTRKVARYKDDDNVGKFVYSIYSDDNSNIWIGSDKGLSIYFKEHNKFLTYNQLLIKSSISVYSIIIDDLKNMWFSTNAGLMKLSNYESYSLEKTSINTYTKEDKLPSNEICINSGYKSSSGEMFYGTNNGLLRFNPLGISDSIQVPNVVFTGLKVDGNRVLKGDIVQGRKILTNDLNSTEKIRISYKSRLFSISFDAVDYSSIGKNGYKYRLKGFDNDWVTSDVYNKEVIYTNLPSGRYTFEIYATYNNAVIDKAYKHLHIEVAKPFYETLLFYLVVLTIVGLVVLLVINLKTRSYKRRQKELIKAVGIRTSELNVSNELLKNQNLEIEEINIKLENQQKEITAKNVLLNKAYKNLNKIKRLGEIITYKLEINDILATLEDSLKSLVQINIIGFGFINKERSKIEFVNFRENGNQLPKFNVDYEDETSFAAYAIAHNTVVVINDLEQEYKSYISRIRIRTKVHPKSLMYIPLVLRNDMFGILTFQSYEANIFTKEVQEFINNLLPYIKISLDNANAYDWLRKNKEELEHHKQYLEELVEQRTQKLEEEKNRAQESDKLKSAFLANMSHEIRTPLNAIIGFVDVLTGDDVDTEQAKYFLNIVQNNAFTLLNLINDIIDFSKIEANQLQVHVEKFEINEILNSCYLNFKELNKEDKEKQEKVKFELKKSDKQEIHVLADKTRFIQVLNNLISNAIKFTEEGNIEFGIYEFSEGEFISIYVKDSGIGISSENLKNIFRRFYKVDGNIKNLYGGTGLGLAITSNLMKLMGGNISVDSEVGKGSVFVVTLPHSME